MVKNNKWLFTLYLIIYILTNIIYIGLELYKFKLRTLFDVNLQGNIYFNKVIELSKVSTGLEYLIAIISIIFLMITLIDCRYEMNDISLKSYIMINVGVWIGCKGMAVIFANLLTITMGNLTQQNILVIYITVIALIVYIFKILNKKIMLK